MIIGNLTRDPEVRTTPSGQTVASFAIATNLSWTDASGQKQEKAEFHNIVAWRKLAEICGQYLKKGRPIYIEGRLQTRDWGGQDGVKRYRTEIVADNMIMLGSPAGSGGVYNQAGSASTPASPGPASPSQNFNSDIPTINYDAPVENDLPNTSSDADSEEEIEVENIPF